MTGDSNMIEAFCVWKQFLEMPEAQQNHVNIINKSEKCLLFLIDHNGKI